MVKRIDKQLEKTKILEKLEVYGLKKIIYSTYFFN